MHCWDGSYRGAVVAYDENSVWSCELRAREIQNTEHRVGDISPCYGRVRAAELFPFGDVVAMFVALLSVLVGGVFGWGRRGKRDMELIVSRKKMFCYHLCLKGRGGGGPTAAQTDC